MCQGMSWCVSSRSSTGVMRKSRLGETGLYTGELGEPASLLRSDSLMSVVSMRFGPWACVMEVAAVPLRFVAVSEGMPLTELRTVGCKAAD
jgi:hypothetical protein